MKALVAICSAISILSSFMLYIIRTEVKSEVSLLRERVIAIETIVPELGQDIRDIKEDVEYMRRNFWSRDEILRDPSFHVPGE